MSKVPNKTALKTLLRKVGKISREFKDKEFNGVNSRKVLAELCQLVKCEKLVTSPEFIKQVSDVALSRVGDQERDDILDLLFIARGCPWMRTEPEKKPEQGVYVVSVVLMKDKGASFAL